MTINNQISFGASRAYASNAAEKAIKSYASPRMSESIDRLPDYGGENIHHVLDKSMDGDYINLSTVLRDEKTGEERLRIPSIRVEGLRNNGYALLERATEHVQALGVAAKKGLTQTDVTRIGSDNLLAYSKLDGLIEARRTK